MQIRTTYKPGDVGYVVYLHGVLYAQEYGLDHTFEGDVANRMGEFIRNFDPNKDLFAVAEDKDQIVGSIAINGLPDNVAQLRWFLLHPSARGAGLGKALLQHAIDFCKQRGFKSISLWTISELKAAAHLYRQAGFQITYENTRDFWGGRRTEQQYEMTL